MTGPSGNPRITVLGASGYLGSAIAAALVAYPGPVRLISRDPRGVGGPRHERRAVALDRPGAMRDALGPVAPTGEVVIHLVADVGGTGTWRTRSDETRADSLEVGILRAVIEWAESRPGTRPLGLVFASTTALNVSAGGATDHGATRYERNKRRAEELVQAATADRIITGTCLRLPTLYGISPPGGLGRGAVQALVRQAVAGGPVTLWGAGDNRRSLLHVADAAAAFVVAVPELDRLAGAAWDVGADSALTLAELGRAVVDGVARATGAAAAPLIRVAPPTAAAAHDLADALVDPRPFMALTGWSPQWSLPAGLAETVRAAITPVDQIGTGQKVGTAS